MNVVILEPHEIAGANEVRLSDARAIHLLRVLKVAPGQPVRVGLLDGPLGIATVKHVGEGTVDLTCVFEETVPPRPAIDVLLALPRPKVLRRLWAQLSAIGVGQIILTNAERVERNYFDTHVVDEASYRPLLIEGLQQARDTRLPRVSIHRQFKVLIEDDLDMLFGEGARLAAHPGDDVSVAEAIARGQGDRVLLAIGPEGGWNTFELDLLAAHGFRAVGMGRRTLRTDTACLALLTLAHAGLRLRLR